MPSPTETLSKMIEALIEEKSVSRRRTHGTAAYDALRALLAQKGPANAREAEESGYQRGMLDAINLLKSARMEAEEPLGKAESIAGPAYVVLSGARNYGASIASSFESKAQHALLESIKRSREG